MRLFIALPLDKTCRETLAGVMGEIERRSRRASLTPPQNLHLTLAFIGQTDRARPAADCISGLEAESFPLVISGIGRFAGREGDLVWAGVKTVPTLVALHNQVAGRLEKAGFLLEKRAFKPHLTLGRRVIFREENDFRDLQRIYPAEKEICAMRAQWVSLMRSDRGEKGMAYTEVAGERLL